VLALCKVVQVKTTSTTYTYGHLRTCQCHVLRLCVLLEPLSIEPVQLRLLAA
jgi:hypothetical protein